MPIPDTLLNGSERLYVLVLIEVKAKQKVGGSLAMSRKSGGDSLECDAGSQQKASRGDDTLGRYNVR
jgi:hypothetical protein